jgi:TPR repeat protein
MDSFLNRRMSILLQLDWDPMFSLDHTLRFLFLAMLLVQLSACAPDNDADCSRVNIDQLESAARAGLPEAQNELGRYHELGECIASDFEKAAGWYQLAAEQGHVNAQKVLGFMYAGGMGVQQDNAISLQWFMRAAEAGHPEAQLGLATAYFRGIGIVRDRETAARWFRKSAEQNFARSQYNLGNLYQNGAGVPRDLVEAYKWYGLSARNGYSKAEKSLAQLNDELPPELINQARQLIEDWRPENPESDWEYKPQHEPTSP